LRLLRSPSMSIGFVINVIFYGMFFVASLFLQRRDGLSPLLTGLAFLPVTATITASNVIGVRQFKTPGPAVFAGALLMGSGCLMVLVTPALPVLIAGLSVIGLGIGLIVPAITASLLASVEQSVSGVASGTLTAFRQTGSMLGVALYGSLAGHSLRSVCGFSVVLAVAVALAVAFLGRESRSHRHPGHPGHPAILNK
jgi:MFS transporter, DHA2 family, methylenomycin A resistance protein